MTSRLYLALGHLQGVRKRKVSQTQLGKEIAALINRAEGDYAQGTVSEWFTSGIRDVEAAWGFAQVCGVREAWLVFNDGAMLPEKSDEEIPSQPLERQPADEEADQAAERIGDAARLIKAISDMPRRPAPPAKPPTGSRRR